jgi:hypothetical protein
VRWKRHLDKYYKELIIGRLAVHRCSRAPCQNHAGGGDRREERISTDLAYSTPTPTLCSIVRWKRHLDKYYKELIIESNSIIEEEVGSNSFFITSFLSPSFENGFRSSFPQLVRPLRPRDKYYKELIIESNSIIEEETILKEFRIEMG